MSTALCPQKAPQKSSRLRFYGCLIFGAGVTKVLTVESVFQTGSAMDEVWFRMWTNQGRNVKTWTQPWRHSSVILEWEYENLTAWLFYTFPNLIGLWGKVLFQCVTWRCNYTVWPLQKFSNEHPKQLREQLRKTWGLKKPHYIVTVPKKQCLG